MAPKIEARYNDGWSPLFAEASAFADEESRGPELPLNKGVDMEANSRHAFIPLMQAGLHLVTAELFLGRCADFGVRNKYGVTALMTAALYKVDMNKT
ncbi:HET domain-containing protein [Fusarium sp. LHS14.1]|nr:HET domain-containing protein [Fusarium sp. LHS14.1]